MDMNGIEPEHAAELDGLRSVQMMLSTKTTNGIGRTMGFRGTSAEFGRVPMEGIPPDAYYNPYGTVHGGYAATLLDAAIGLAVHTTLPPATGFATVDLKVTYLRPMTKDSGPVLAEGVVIHSGKRIVASEAKLVDRNGKLCAHATATCLIFPSASKELP
jgi:uncharacterized protein (TIGR00369 family)